MSQPIIEIQNLSFAYNSQKVLKDVSLTIKQGEFLALIGPNGGGKTTLLKLILGLLNADKGTIRVFGHPPRKASHRIGYVPQDVHVNKDFPVTAMDVVLMGRRTSGKGRARHSKEDRGAARNALETVGMGDFIYRRIGRLSGGQRQRVFIARALATDPDVLLLDEPTASIDPQGQSDFYTLLKDLNETVTVVLVSHDLMILTSYVRSVACVNQQVHYHEEAEMTEEMLTMYACPVELVAHGIPHRVLRKH
ncbi:MAG TPA: ABC transporter ATP-binding protein [Deltaproteobacteria bacterium]|nr:ABC transporter ATP-binding protein [Deltaproteobacteria bacterium]